MKVNIPILIIAFLCFVLFYQEHRINNFQTLNNHLIDSLSFLNIETESKTPFSDYQHLRDSILYKEDTLYDESIIETHEILINKWKHIQYFKIKCKDDSTYTIIYKKINRMALYHKERTKIIETNIQQILDKSVWVNFKSKLNALGIYKCTMKNLGCWDNKISWSASINGRTYGFTSRYGTSRFSNTIDFLISHVIDKDNNSAAIYDPSFELD